MCIDDGTLSVVWSITHILGQHGYFHKCRLWEQSGETTGHEQVGDHWESFEEIPVLAQHFTEILIGLDPMEFNGLFDITIGHL